MTVRLVHHALDAWSWFWIAIEATTLFVITSLLLIAAWNRGVQGAWSVSGDFYSYAAQSATAGLGDGADRERAQRRNTTDWRILRSPRSRTK